jgi:3-oxoacyl-[acyl-carrier protein] reductase
VVTGGARGLGWAITEAMVAEGAQVVVASRSGVPPAGAPAQVRGHEVDVVDGDSVNLLLDDVLHDLGRVDVMVCNAGVSYDGTINRLDADRWRRTLDTNVTGTFLCTQAAARVMRSAGSGGRIITVSSCVASRVAVGASAYSASKAAVEMFTRSAAVELARDAITVNCLAPGYFDAGMGRQVAADSRAWQMYRPRLLAGRLGTAAEIGAAAVFLASDDSSYINGHVLEINGGLNWA